jgi:hypothetical protein
MASYYYLIASLPELKADGDMPVTYEEFLTCCRGNVGEEEMEMLEKLSLASREGPLLKEWSDFYGALRGELNYQRSVNLGKSYTQSYDKDNAVAQVVSTALAAQNPLEAERILLEYEFANLDLIVGSHMFDSSVLFGYALKLKLLERQNSFEHEKGKAEFKSLFDGIQAQVYSL